MNFLVIGGGSIGKRHIRNLKSLGYSNIWCLKRNKDVEFEKETGSIVVVDISEINQDINAVFVCTPTSLHYEGIKIAIKLRAAIFMEKPLIHELELLDEIRQLLIGYDRPFFIGFMLRFHPLVKKIKDVVDKDKLGKVYSARFEFGSYLPFWHPWEDYRVGYAARKELGGGVINTITHELDLIQFIFGKPDSLLCQKMNAGKLSINVEEIAETIFRYNDKLVSLHLDYLQKDYDRKIRILCDEGYINWNWHDNQLIIKKYNEQPEIIHLENFDVNQLYVDELKTFIDIISNQIMKHELDIDHALNNTELTIKMHESADNNKTVKLI